MQSEPISLCNLLQTIGGNTPNEVKVAIAKLAELDVVELIL